MTKLHTYIWEPHIHGRFNEGEGKMALASVAQLVGTSSRKPKSSKFDSWSWHMPKSWVPSPVWVYTGGNLLIFLPRFNVSLSQWCFSPLFSLPSSLSKHVLRWGLKKRKNEVITLWAKELGKAPGASERRKIICSTVSADVQRLEVCPALHVGHKKFFWW